jgi:hypothetical protein
MRASDTSLGLRGNQRDQDDYPVYQDLGWICLR